MDWQTGEGSVPPSELSRTSLTRPSREVELVEDPDATCNLCPCSLGDDCVADDEATKSVGTKGSTDDQGDVSFKTSKLTPFTLRWTFGINLDLPVINLISEGRSLICFAAAHSAVVYDFVNTSMVHLSGHKHSIKSMSTDASGRWLAVADSGDENVITMWDAANSILVSTIEPQPLRHTALIGLSPNAKYLVSVDDRNNAEVSMRIWTLGNEHADDTFKVKGCGAVKGISFNLFAQEQIMIAFAKQVVFVTWDVKGNKFKEPIMPEVRNKKHIGRVTGCTYMARCHHCVAVTDEGCVLVFGNTLYTQDFEESDIVNNKIFTKTIKVSSLPITCVTSVDSLIVTGDISGRIKFYDSMVRILYWYQSFELKSIRSVSFDLDPRYYELRDPTDFDNDDFFGDNENGDFEDRSGQYEIFYTNMVPSDATLQKNPFVVRDFVVSTFDGNIYRINYLKNECEPLFWAADDVVAALDTHYERPFLCIAYANGRIALYNYANNQKILDNVLPEAIDEETEEKVTVTYIKYSPQALHLACSRSNGEVWMLDQMILTEKYETPLQGARYKIEKICFSPDSTLMAHYDEMRTVCLFKYLLDDHIWQFMGKIRAHQESINDMIFAPYLPTRLFTIGEDRRLVEYELDCEPGEFTANKSDRIEQSAVPLTFIYEPKDPETAQRYLLIANDHFKYKKLNDKTLKCHSVALGPVHKCYDKSPVYKMTVIPRQDCDYMIFATKKHIGLQLLPLDGNPYKYIGSVGHPEEIKDFCLSSCGRFVFICGENDRTVAMWSISLNAVDLLYKFGGKELEPYYCLIEGGKDGWLFNEMQDLFYYMQILDQGENTILPRVISDYIPISDLPDLMRACGYYLTEFESDNLIADITQRDIDYTGIPREEVSFPEFVQLYINHRHAHGVSIGELEEAFNTIVETCDGYGSVSKDDFVDTICLKGETCSRDSAYKCLAILMRSDEPNPDEEALSSFSILPDDISFDMFVDEMLGFDMENAGFQITKDI